MNSPRESKIRGEARPQIEDEKQLPDIATAKFKVSQGKMESLSRKANPYSELLKVILLHVSRLLIF